MKSIGAKFTDAQYEGFVAARGELDNSAYVRQLVAADCRKKDIDWPEDMQQHGGNRVLSCPACQTFNVHVVDDVLICFDCEEVGG